MKTAKLIFLILSSILVLNAISWLFIGKEKALDLSLNYFDYLYSPSDTLFVYSIFTIESDIGKIVYEYDDFSKFKERTKKLFLTKLNSQDQVKNVKFVDSTIVLFSDYEPGLGNFFIDLEYNYPFYLNVISGIAVNGFGGEYEQNFIWFFRWWEIGEAGRGMS